MPPRSLIYCATLAALSFSPPLAAGPAEEARALSREAYGLEGERRERVTDILERDPELKALTEQAKEASRKIYEALKTHPALANVRAKWDTAFTQMMHTISKGDAAAHEAAKETYTQAEHAITTQGRAIPEIQALMG